MDCGGRLESVVKGSEGRLVIGWHQDVAVCLCVCVHSQTISEYCKVKYISLQPDCIAYRVLICCHPLALQWILISSITDIVYYFLQAPLPNTPQYLCSVRGKVPSETRHDGSTELLLVFNCPLPQGLLGASWAGLNIFSRGMRRGWWQNTRSVRCRWGEKSRRGGWQGNSGETSSGKPVIQMQRGDRALYKRRSTQEASITCSSTTALTDTYYPAGLLTDDTSRNYYRA